MAAECTVMGLEGSGINTIKGKGVAWPFWIDFLATKHVILTDVNEDNIQDLLGQFATYLLEFTRANSLFYAPGTIVQYFSRVKEKIKAKNKTWNVWIDSENTHQWVCKIRNKLTRKAAQRRHNNGEAIADQTLPADEDMIHDVSILLLISKKPSKISMASVVCTNWHR